jgi:tetratricopeptide (TPR) repeat protein
MSSLQPASEKIRQFLSSLSDADLQELSSWFAAGQSEMLQLNTGNAKAFQVQVQGGTVYVGDRYEIDQAALKQVLRELLHDRQLPTVGTPQNLPYSGVTQFVGRQDELERLHQQLQPGSPVAISAVSGMGGIGKTELALEYARQQYRVDTYPGGVCWLRAREDVGSQIISFARSQLNLTPPDDLELAEKVRWCWSRWREGAALVILDDVQDYGEVRSFLPPPASRFQVLMTTRSQFGPPVQAIRLDVLAEAEALELLRLLVPDDRIDRELQQSKELCDWLGCLPLGIELVGRYLSRKPDLSIAQLQQRLQTKRLDAIAFKQAEPGMTASLGVAAAFELSWQDLSESAQQLTAVLSLFALVEIPWALVEQCLPETDAEELEEIRDRSLWEANLLKRVGQGMYQLHQLLREFFAVKRSQRTDDAELQRQFYQVVIVAAERVEEKPERSLIKESTIMITHLQAAIERLDRPEQALDLATCLYRMANLYYEQGRYAEAEPLYLQSLEMRQQHLGNHHLNVAESLNDLATLYQEQGRYAEAELLFMQSLSIFEQQLGVDHSNVAISLNNLALLYSLQGRYGEAEPLYVRSLSMREQQLGANHSDVAISLNGLARLYRSQERYAEAEPLLQRSLSILQTQLPADHPLTARVVSNLAHLYDLQRRYPEAESLYLHALPILSTKLTENHSWRQDVANNWRSFLQKATQAQRTDELSNAPVTRSLPQELQDSWD